jgi:hypothetical protein
MELSEKLPRGHGEQLQRLSAQSAPWGVIVHFRSNSLKILFFVSRFQLGTILNRPHSRMSVS